MKPTPVWSTTSECSGSIAHISSPSPPSSLRRILVEHARRHNLKRGRGHHHVSFDEAVLVRTGEDPDLVALDDALNALAEIDPRKVQVVEMRFFGGLSIEETAEVLKISMVTVKRDWKAARLWLYRELAPVLDSPCVRLILSV